MHTADHAPRLAGHHSRWLESSKLFWAHLQHVFRERCSLPRRVRGVRASASKRPARAWRFEMVHICKRCFGSPAGNIQGNKFASPWGSRWGWAQRLSARREVGNSRSLKCAEYFVAHLLDIFWEMNSFLHRVRDGRGSAIKRSTCGWQFEIAQIWETFVWLTCSKYSGE